MLEQLLATPGTVAAADHAWRNDAACLTEDPELFFPEGESERYRPQIEAALGVCAGCAVAASCLSYALETEQRTGIWGGTTAATRRGLELARSGASDGGRGPVFPATVGTGPIGAEVAGASDAGLRRAAG